MQFIKRYIIALIFVVPAFQATAQSNIAGCWEGDLGTDQFLQINIVQNGDKICGYTYDYVKADLRSYCLAYFTGRYDKAKGKWLFEGTSFIENSGGHFLMRMSLGNHFADGEFILEGNSNVKSVIIQLLSGGGAPDYVYLKKVSNRPKKIFESMKDCFPEEKKPVDTVVKKPPVTQKPADTIASTPPAPVKPADTIAVITPPPVPPKDTVSIPTQLVKRKNTEQNRVEVNVRSITLNVYDNAIMDGDTVSIFYNDKLLLSHRRLSEKPIVIDLELDEKQTRHEIILFAENLGSIPPNTALIVVNAGNKRYELFASASLEENAVLVFDYKPK